MLTADAWMVFEPPDRMTILPSDPLMSFLQGSGDTSVRISMRHQSRPDCRVLQVLLTAAQAWRGRHLGFDVCDLPPRLAQDFARLGLTAENTEWSGLK